MAIYLYSSHDRVSMALLDTFSVTPASEDTRCASKEKLFVDAEKLILPKGVLVENIGGE